MRNIVWILLAALLAAGCKTATVEPPVVTEVTLPDAKPFVLPSAVVETNPPVVVAPPAPVAPTNTPAPPRITVPASGWVPLETWSLANALGPPRKIRADEYTVATRTGQVVIQLGSQMARWAGIEFWLGFAPRIVGGQPCLHWLDAQKTLEPLLHGVVPSAKPERVLVIDPGHGGVDGGTHGTKLQLEKNFALDWALRLQTLLSTNGWKVFLTRSTDVDVSLTNRVSFADRVGADLFVSLHFNGLSTAATHSGVETFCLTPSGLPSSVTRGFEDDTRTVFPNNTFDSENLQYAFRVHREVLAATHAVDGGVRHARFMSVLRAQHRPAVLIEGGFLSNAEEARRISTPAYRQKLAEAVARALTP